MGHSLLGTRRIWVGDMLNSLTQQWFRVLFCLLASEGRGQQQLTCAHAEVLRLCEAFSEASSGAGRSSAISSWLFARFQPPLLRPEFPGTGSWLEPIGPSQPRSPRVGPHGWRPLRVEWGGSPAIGHRVERQWPHTALLDLII